MKIRQMLYAGNANALLWGHADAYLVQPNRIANTKVVISRAAIMEDPKIFIVRSFGGPTALALGTCRARDAKVGAFGRKIAIGGMKIVSRMDVSPVLAVRSESDGTAQAGISKQTLQR